MGNPLEISDERKEELKQAAVVLHALSKGPITNYGFLVDAETNAIKGISPADMRKIIQDIHDICGMKVERIDAGGRSTWAIVN